jgi:hypothetical protein
MPPKKFRIPGSEIKPLATGRGGCMATDMITVQGKRVGYMYRVAPDPRSEFRHIDSGWRFLSGTESQQYLDEPSNMAIHDVNTIANYDLEIIPLLDAPVGLAFERDKSGNFVAVAPPPEE